MDNKSLKSLELRQLLSMDCYKVPVYQRNYDWAEPQIQQLIDDIQDYSEQKHKPSEYYIGSLVVHEKPEYFEILDGQQRFTTLSLLAFYLKHRLPDSFLWYEKPNLGFESRTKSEMAISQLFKILLPNKSTKYDSPEHLSELISVIDTNKTNPSILNGFRAIDRVITRNFADQKPEALKEFSSYLLERVKILRVCVPKNTDVTHYFEVMNNRGEQLEKHEVVKANLLSAVQNDTQAMATISKVWHACADMSRYVQTGFLVDNREAIFGAESTVLVVKSFDDLTEIITVQGDDSSLTDGFLSLTESLAAGRKLPVKEDKRNSNDDNDEGKAERFNSVIDFPNFLMQALRIYLKAELCKELPALDDKALIEAFKQHIGKDVQKVKDFIFTLLRIRYLFDNYIVKRESTSGKEDWSLKRYKFDKISSSYVNSFGKDESYKSSANWSCAMLLSAFHVSYPTNSRKNWLSAVLYWLSDNEHSKLITAENYLEFLESLAKSFMVNRYLIAESKEYKDFMYVINTANQYDVAFEDLDTLLSYGRVRVFVFNYLDYLLWKDDKYSIDKKNAFRFSFKNSVEHFSPQTSRINEILDKTHLHGFGNLCLIGSSENSSLSNDIPYQKTKILESQRSKMAPLSLKLELMMQTAENRWDVNTIELHRDDMVKTLQRGIELPL